MPKLSPNSTMVPQGGKGGGSNTLIIGVVVGIVGLLIVGMALVVGIGAFWGGKDGKVSAGAIGDAVLAANPKDPAVAKQLNNVKAAIDPEGVLKSLEKEGGAEELRRQLNEIGTGFVNYPGITAAQRAKVDTILKQARDIIDNELVPITLRTKASSQNKTDLKKVIFGKYLPKVRELSALLQVKKTAAFTVDLARLMVQKNNGGKPAVIRHPGAGNGGYRSLSTKTALSFTDINKAADYLFSVAPTAGMDCSGFISNLLIASGITEDYYNTASFAETKSLFPHKYNLGVSNQSGAVIDPNKVVASSFLPGDIIITGLASGANRAHVVLILDNQGNIAQSTNRNGFSGPQLTTLAARKNIIAGTTDQPKTLDRDTVVIRPKYEGE